MTFPLVTIQIATFNSSKYLPECLKSIFNQTYRDFQVLVIDNNSQDDTVDYLKKNYPEVTVFQNKKNLGFARANNQGIRLLNSPYVVFCNPDIILEPDWLEMIVAKAEDSSLENIGSFGGKLYKLKMTGDDFNELERSNIIDSCGLSIAKNHQIVELGAGGKDDGFDEEKETFGHSAALVMYKRQALEDIRTRLKNIDEYFDEDFFFYKEDVDLAWRMQLAGWKSLFLPIAKAYHMRAMASEASRGLKQLVKNRKKQSKIAKRYSYRNHFFVLVKNQFGANLMKYLPQIFWYELEKALYVLFFEWSSLPAIWQVIRLLPKMSKKRKYILIRARVDSEYVRNLIQ
ncbi:MAG TPA: glycosyltransferase family 2 protein [Patescibacteria group bacterium]|nr:glycosyltransferase family 2 protein [Patescibacteria group bacterium]